MANNNKYPTCAVFELDVSQETYGKIDFLTTLGEPAKSLTIISVPVGVSFFVNRGGYWLKVNDTDIFDHEDMPELQWRNIGTSSSKVVLYASTGATFDIGLIATQVAKYTRSPAD